MNGSLIKIPIGHYSKTRFLGVFLCILAPGKGGGGKLHRSDTDWIISIDPIICGDRTKSYALPRTMGAYGGTMRQVRYDKGDKERGRGGVAKGREGRGL